MAEKIVKNDSQGYGYNYASLSDIAKQGFEIPKMKTESDDLGNEYVCYLDGNEWIRGAKVVVPENIVNKEGKNKMNAAQLYGSALTYARRYTTLMALSLVCEDDKNLENTEPEKATQKQIDYLLKLYTFEEIQKILEHYQVEYAVDLPKNVVSQYINDRTKNEKE